MVLSLRPHIIIERMLNSMTKLFPVLLAGGSGSRLWPLSRKTYPKQFSKLLGDRTLFQSSAQRLTSSETLTFEAPITLTNADYRFIVTEQLQEAGIDPGPILIEPEAKNTAAAILAASLFAHNINAHAILLVAPSDHVISDTKAYHDAITVGLSHVKNSKLVTFGIKPVKPETAYGYLELSEDTLDAFGTSAVNKFIEKPSLDKASKMLVAKNYLWNAGIFLFRARDMIAAFKRHAPKTHELVSQSVIGASTDLGFLRLDAEYWSSLDDISIDYAIMENSDNLVAVPYTSDWSDLGGWDAIWSESSKDTDGNVTSDTAHAIDCTNSLIRSENTGQQLVGIGLDNILAVAMPDAVLIAHKNRSQDVKKAVQLLKSKDILQAEIFPKDHRPWGWFESLVLGDVFQVKRIFVNPGAALSLQSHKYRSEHWIVVEGTAKVTIDEQIKLISAGQSIYVPLGAVHRMANPGKEPMEIIEVQIGTYFGEDDIVRYEDVYARS